jgi:hypothetical protein
MQDRNQMAFIVAKNRAYQFENYHWEIRAREPGGGLCEWKGERGMRRPTQMRPIGRWWRSPIVWCGRAKTKDFGTSYLADRGNVTRLVAPRLRFPA